MIQTTINASRKFLNFINFPLYIDWSYQQPDCTMHDHSCGELVIVRQGTAQNISRFPKFRVSQGDVFVIPQGELHRYEDTDNFYIVNVLYKLDTLAMPLRDAYILPGYGPLFAYPEKYAHENNSLPFFHLNNEDFDKVMNLLTKMTQEYEREEGRCKFYMTGMFMELIVLLSRAYKGVTPHIKRTHEGIEKALKFMRGNLKNNVSIAEIAHAAGMSISTLTRAFRSTTGDSPIKYLIKLRVSEAADLLINSDLNMTEIALETGFSDSNYFTKTFLRETGLTPTGFRKKIRS